MVGATGIEPATPCTPCKYSTRLSYAPTTIDILKQYYFNYKYFFENLYHKKNRRSGFLFILLPIVISPLQQSNRLSAHRGDGGGDDGATPEPASGQVADYDV